MPEICIDRRSIIAIRAYFAELYNVVGKRASVGDDLDGLRPKAAVTGTAHGTYTNSVTGVAVETCKGERIGRCDDHAGIIRALQFTEGHLPLRGVAVLAPADDCLVGQQGVVRNVDSNAIGDGTGFDVGTHVAKIVACVTIAANGTDEEIIGMVAMHATDSAYRRVVCKESAAVTTVVGGVRHLPMRGVAGFVPQQTDRVAFDTCNMDIANTQTTACDHRKAHYSPG